MGQEFESPVQLLGKHWQDWQEVLPVLQVQRLLQVQQRCHWTRRSRVCLQSTGCRCS